MPKAGSGGPETYTSNTEPPQAVEGDYWYNGLTVRLRTRAGWITIAGPADISALSATV